MIKLQNINFRYKNGKYVLNDINLEIKEGEFISIIGKNGSMLKEIGRLSRIDIEEFLGKKVYLELFVKTIKDWRNKENIFNDLGINELEN